MNLTVVVPRETRHGEQRVALVPDDVLALTQKGFSVGVEQGAGEDAGFLPEQYVQAGGHILKIQNNAFDALYSRADIIVRVKRAIREREALENKALPEKSVMMGFLDPLDRTTPHVNEWIAGNVTTISLDQLPLNPGDPKNVLAAMSEIAGKLAVKDAIEKRESPPESALVIGTGTSGLAAIKECLARGLQTTAMGTSSRTKEEIEALGATFLHLARDLPQEEQQEELLPSLVQADITITTARRAGQPAPLLITSKALEQMKRGSVIVDLALTEGGNVEGSGNDQTLTLGNGVIVTNNTGYPKKDPCNASKAYSSGMRLLIEHFTAKGFEPGDPLFDAAFVTYNSQRNPAIFNP